MTATIDIVIECDSWTACAGLEAGIERAALAALAASGVTIRPGAELAVLLADDATIAGLNARWRGKPQPTNVLSFPAATPEALAQSPMIGDIALAYETCAGEAVAEGKSLSDHLAHLVVHGTLHLAGYDHEQDAEAERMEALERQVLAGLGIADPYGPAHGEDVA